jgi:hypothetical protein
MDEKGLSQKVHVIIMNTLPKELLVNIFSKLSIESLGRLSCTSKTIQEYLYILMQNLYLEQCRVVSDVAELVEHNLQYRIPHILVFRKDFQKLKIFAQFPKPYKIVFEYKLKCSQGFSDLELVHRESYTMFSFLKLTASIKSLCNRDTNVMNTLFFPQAKRIKGII